MSTPFALQPANQFKMAGRQTQLQDTQLSLDIVHRFFCLGFSHAGIVMLQIA